MDYFLVKRSNQKCVMECKVILGETVRTQHGLLVMDYKMIEPKVIPMKCEIRITVWKLADERINKEFIKDVRQKEYISESSFNEI